MPSLTLANSLRATITYSPFSPASLFSGGAPGVWYDPSDYTTLFQDAAGTTPVTAVEQPVGLMLDKSQGLVLGPELVTNGTFDSGITGWTAGFGTTNSTLSASSGSATLTVVSPDTVPRFGQAISGLTVGKFYRVSCSVFSSSGSGDKFLGWTSLSNLTGGESWLANQTTPRYYAATATTMYVWFGFNNSSAGSTITIDNISVKQLPGNHAFQSTSASRPVLSARYNLLTKTEQFDDAAWTKTNTTVTANTTATTDPLGGNTADKIVETSASGIHIVRQGNLTTVATNYTFSAYLKAAERTWVLFNADTVGGASGYAEVYVDLTNGTFGTQAAGNGYTIVSKSITSAGDGWWLVSLTCTATSNAGAGVQIFLATGNGTNNYTGNGTSGIYTWGAQLVATNNLPSNTYQRVNTSTDYATTGFLPYLKFDGVDDSLSTNSINFTSTDKMSVFAGVRKLSDAAVGMLMELSASLTAGNNGAFYYVDPNTPATTEMAIRGSTSANILSSYNGGTAPITRVTSAVLNLAASTRETALALRQNGATVGTTGAITPAGGNYGNYPLYIGRRGGSTIPFNGQLYSMIIVGKAVNAVELTSTETYTASKTGVVLA